VDPTLVLKTFGTIASALAGAWVAASARLLGVAVPEAAVIGMSIGGGALLIVWRGVRILSSAADAGDRINRETIARLEAENAELRARLADRDST
jgi:hypothetical protein